MTNYYLRTNTVPQMVAALAMIPEPRYIDMIGTLGAVLDEHGVEIAPADLRIHANVRCETLAPALLATLPTCFPATPRREFV
jgi:hypothetical protein